VIPAAKGRHRATGPPRASPSRNDRGQPFREPSTPGGRAVPVREWLAFHPQNSSATRAAWPAAAAEEARDCAESHQGLRDVGDPQPLPTWRLGFSNTDRVARAGRACQRSTAVPREGEATSSDPAIRYRDAAPRTSGGELKKRKHASASSASAWISPCGFLHVLERQRAVRTSSPSRRRFWENHRGMARLKSVFGLRCPFASGTTSALKRRAGIAAFFSLLDPDFPSGSLAPQSWPRLQATLMNIRASHPGRAVSRPRRQRAWLAGAARVLHARGGMPISTPSEAGALIPSSRRCRPISPTPIQLDLTSASTEPESTPEARGASPARVTCPPDHSFTSASVPRPPSYRYPSNALGIPSTRVRPSSPNKKKDDHRPEPLSPSRARAVRRRRTVRTHSDYYGNRAHSFHIAVCRIAGSPSRPSPERGPPIRRPAPIGGAGGQPGPS